MRETINADETFQAWIADLKNIKDDIHELFSLRRTFRDVADVFRDNLRLQSAGGHLWDWMLLNYVASVLVRIRRLVDSQHGTVCLKQLMHAVINRPDVITRGRRYAVHGPIEGEHLRELLDQAFTETWVKTSNSANSEGDRVDPDIVRADLRALEGAVENVAEFANRTIAHKTRVAPGNVTYAELDEAFNAIEATLKKYYGLIVGSGLTDAEPVPQFDTHEVFTFPWIESRQGQ